MEITETLTELGVRQEMISIEERDFLDKNGYLATKRTHTET